MAVFFYTFVIQEKKYVIVEVKKMISFYYERIANCFLYLKNIQLNHF